MKPYRLWIAAKPFFGTGFLNQAADHRNHQCRNSDDPGRKPYLAAHIDKLLHGKIVALVLEESTGIADRGQADTEYYDKQNSYEN